LQKKQVQYYQAPSRQGQRHIKNRWMGGCLLTRSNLKHTPNGGFETTDFKTVALSFSTPAVATFAKNTTRPLTVWIGGTDIERGLFLVERCVMLEPISKPTNCRFEKNAILRRM